MKGMGMYSFEEWKKSRHLRYTKVPSPLYPYSPYSLPHLSHPSLSHYTKASLYQGEWTGVPLFTPLKPHGEGVAVFFDGWGYCREAKMLQVRRFGRRFGDVLGSLSSLSCVFARREGALI